MPESEDLLGAGEEALHAASILAANGLWADAISRAYYSMIYAARALLATKGLHPRTHRGAVHLLGQEFVRTGMFPREEAARLTAAMAFRDRADYGWRGDLEEADARRTVDAARTFLDAAKKILTSGQGSNDTAR